MLLNTDQHFVPFGNKGLAKRKSNQVDGRRGTGSEHNLFTGSSIQKSPDSFPGALIGIRGQIRQMMNSTMYIGVFFQGKSLIKPGHSQWALGRSSIIQIYQWFPVYTTGKDRKLGAKFRD